jgi:hypothetical protein
MLKYYNEYIKTVCFGVQSEFDKEHLIACKNNSEYAGASTASKSIWLGKMKASNNIYYLSSIIFQNRTKENIDRS